MVCGVTFSPSADNGSGIRRCGCPWRWPDKSDGTYPTFFAEAPSLTYTVPVQKGLPAVELVGPLLGTTGWKELQAGTVNVPSSSAVSMLAS